MSSRTSSQFGALGQRVAATARAATSGGTPFCLVDGVHPGVVARWANQAGAWEALVAFIQDDLFHVAVLPASGLKPASAGPMQDACDAETS